MSKLADLKLAEKIQASGRRGVIVGLALAALICLTVAAVIIKCRWLKKHFGCCGGDIADIDGGCEEDGCCYTSEKDFV